MGKAFAWLKNQSEKGNRTESLPTLAPDAPVPLSSEPVRYIGFLQILLEIFFAYTGKYANAFSVFLLKYKRKYTINTVLSFRLAICCCN